MIWCLSLIGVSVLVSGTDPTVGPSASSFYSGPGILSEIQPQKLAELN